MKILLTILLFCGLNAFSQSYVLQWRSIGHTFYSVQKSTDNITWTTINTRTRNLTDTIFNYTIIAPVKFNYYRVIADDKISNVIYVPNIKPTIVLQLNYEIKLQ